MPIFKKGLKKDPSNNRPVSLTSQVGKVLERIMKSHIMEHLETYSLISKHQHGFMKKKSTQSNLLETFEEWTKALDDKNGLDVVYLDYRKAFDTVPHKRLVRKLKGYGIRDKMLNWVEDFLRDRKQ